MEQDIALACNEILTRLGYQAPEVGELYSTALPKLLTALQDIEKRLNV